MVFVVNKLDQPLMPCSPCKARKLLDAKKARVKQACPLTIELLHGSSGYKQEVVAGLDTGSTVVGYAAIANGKVVYQAEVTLRNDITGKLDQRRMYRRNRHNRKTRYRAARFKSDGGPDTKENLTTLCKTCHDDLHAGLYELSKKGKRSATEHATEMGIIKSRLAQSSILHEVTLGYETKFKRQQLGWAKTHANDAVAICMEDGEAAIPSETILLKKHQAAGNYQQTKDRRSEIRIPTGKLFGLRRGDKVRFSGGTGVVKGKRSTGYFCIADGESNDLHASELVANCKRLSARSTTQIDEITLAKLNNRRKEAEMRKAEDKAAKQAKKDKAAAAAQPAPFLLVLKDGVS